MKHFFIDTNIVIDYLIDRMPFADAAHELFSNAESKRIKLYISAISYSNIYYLLRRSKTNNEVLSLLDDLIELTEVVDITKSIIKEALKADFKDFEDAIQYHCALTINKIDAIVTRDNKDFKKSRLAVISPGEAISIIEQTKK